MDYIAEWANLLVRWLHLITGIAWIGSSFYFVWLDNHLKAPADPSNPRIFGEVWSVHGGGFYHNQKYLLGPERLPEELHWFKWEAYFTWMSGISMLAIVYWWGAEAYLIDKAVLDISAPVAILSSIALLLGGWLVYDALCKTKLVEDGLNFLVLGSVLVVITAFLLTKLYSGRGAYIHIGAMLGTVMVANVFFVIIPGQRKMVEAIRAGQAPDPRFGKWGKQRSVHNNYMTLPVLFIMISNHYPMTYGHAHSWAVLAAMIVAGVLIRHFFNLRHRGKVVWALPISAAVIIAGLAAAIAPRSQTYVPLKPYTAEQLAFQHIQPIIAERCQGCHAARPTIDGFAAPPAGVMLQTPEQIKRWSQRILDVAVINQIMPAGNLTEMTDGERDLLGAWIAAGAKVQ